MVLFLLKTGGRSEMKRYQWKAELVVDIPREAEQGFFEGLEDAISAYLVSWSRRNAWKTGDLTAEVHEIPATRWGVADRVQALAVAE